jgi:putative transport protein
MPETLTWVGDILRRYPEIGVFLTLALGYALGRCKVRGFGLGTVVGTLIVGMIVGQAHLEINPFARQLFFLLFMFATGYHVGPQVFASLRRGGAHLVVLALVFAFTALGVTILVAWILRLDAGLAAGLFSGALTQSSAIGTSTDAIERLPLPKEEITRLVGHVPVADAVTYLYGTIGVTLLLTKVFPRVMRVDLRTACAEFEETLGGALAKGEQPMGFEAAIHVDVQAFRLRSPSIAGRAVADLESDWGPQVQVARVRRGQRAFRPDKESPLEPGDIVVLTGPRDELLRVGPSLGEQVVDPAAMEVPFKARTVIITNPRVVGLRVSELRGLDAQRGRGLHVRHMSRQGEPLPMLPGTILQRGDAIELIGTPDDLDRVTPLLGVADVPTDRTSFVLLGLTVAIGAVVGSFAIRIGGVPVGMGTGGGVLLAGLLVGWLQTHYPRLGRIPAPSIWLMENLGLHAFIAMVAISAGPHAVEAIQSSGVGLLLASVVVATVPHAVTFAVGWYLFRLNGGLLMGVLSGSGTITAGLQALVDESDSAVPVFGYTVPYAINSILLTAWGPVVVAASQLWASAPR